MEEFKHLKIQLEDIKAATDNFAENKVIGTGGFGKVYKGEVSHSRGRSMVAIKRLDRRYGQGDPEFWKEIMMLSRCTHQNLISLLGFCDEGGEKILVYEHASNGSLDRHLRSTSLTWAQRMKICLDAATGVKYLHDHKGTQQRILHRDIKSSNILLDECWNAKVSDMGMSKIGPANQQHTVLFTNVVGTPGYCDPQYMMTYALTKESDIYSFGVVLFEVLCGRLCFKYSNRQLEVLVPMWKQSYKHKKLESIVFGDLEKLHPSALEAFSDIAFRCLKKSRIKRPTISHVVEKLKSALEFQVHHFHELEYTQILQATIPPKTSIGERIMLLSSEVFLNGLQMIIRNEDLEKLRELGSGTSGTVYQGLWKGTDVAINYIKKESSFAFGSSDQEELTLEFWREAHTLSKLHHPNVMAFYGVLRDGPDGTLATITEFMVDGSLRNVLIRKDMHLDRRRRLIIAKNAACGMDYVHSKNVVHFNLKCSNLLVNLKDPSRPICKVAGFELSKIRRNSFISGGIRGTLPWMAPELLNGVSNKVSEKVDVFSFGIVLWEILTGEEPYANMHYGAIVGGIVNNTLRPRIPSYCDPEWRSLMQRCWSPYPDVRPSFAEISKQLREMCAGHETLQVLENSV